MVRMPCFIKKERTFNWNPHFFRSNTIRLIVGIEIILVSLAQCFNSWFRKLQVVSHTIIINPSSKFRVLDSCPWKLMRGNSSILLWRFHYRQCLLILSSNFKQGSYVVVAFACEREGCRVACCVAGPPQLSKWQQNANNFWPRFELATYYFENQLQWKWGYHPDKARLMTVCCKKISIFTYIKGLPIRKYSTRKNSNNFFLCKISFSTFSLTPTNSKKQTGSKNWAETQAKFLE